MEPEDFDDFFKALHGHRPFKWQSRLAKQVYETGGWPEYIAMPTSAGKTAALDIAVFHMALEGNKPLKERKAPRRIFFVVDRRLVVDEAYERSMCIANTFCTARNDNQGILGEVANRLAELAGEDADEPLVVKRLRGGLPRERAFIKNPLQPTIVLSTVDQVGSRLLFRGYGVSEFMRPIHGALVGVDSLIILDEAHLSQPFTQTLHWARRYQSEGWAEKPLVPPITAIHMTATPPPDHEPFGLEKEDREDDALAPRLSASKPAKLIEIKTDTEDSQAAQRKLASTIANTAQDLIKNQLKDNPAPVIGVIANRVATARMIFEQLKESSDYDIVLLIGRTRPYEREQLLKEYGKRMRAGRNKDDNPRPLFVVATQTVEVGANLDFDGLVTEAAPLDALRQRFGRLNRLGEREGSEAVIVFDKSSPKDDAIYGGATVETWRRFLAPYVKKKRGQKYFDFGISALNSVLAEFDDISKFNSPTGDAPVLMPAHVDMLIQTSPRPAVEPDIPLYLHGADAQQGDVQIVWRADLPANIDEADENSLKATLRILPPSQSETLSLPDWAARALFNKKVAGELSDIEGVGSGDSQSPPQGARKVIRWRGADDIERVSPNAIRTGDTVLVPAVHGGLDCYGWNPLSTEKVEDIAEEATHEQRGKTLLRIHPDLLDQWFKDGAESIEGAKQHLKEALSEIDSEDAELEETCNKLIENILLLDALHPEIKQKLEDFSDPKTRHAFIYPTVEKAFGIVLEKKENTLNAFTDEDDASSFTREVELGEHCSGVGTLARHYAKECGLDKDLIGDVALGSNLHDIGKADPRFQAVLRGGERATAKHENKLLAKSSRNVSNPRDRRAIRQSAGLPEGDFRHECYSVGIVDQNEQLLTKAHDPELVRYLVGIHHGRGRPFMPAIDDPGMEVTFDFEDNKIVFQGRHDLEKLHKGWADLFWTLIRRYGYWGLTYLETLVRLADHRRSEQGK